MALLHISYLLLPCWIEICLLLLQPSSMLLWTKSVKAFGLTITKPRPSSSLSIPTQSISTISRRIKTNLIAFVSRNNDEGQNYPIKIEEWDNQHVESWLIDLGFSQYVQGFASDADGIGIDGDRLVYLGTEDQLDHIEWQMSLLGVNNESDQWLLGESIRQLVAASEINASLLESLSLSIPAENRASGYTYYTESNDSNKNDVSLDDYQI